MGLDFTQPGLALGAGAAVQQVSLDLIKPEQHFWG